MVSSPGFPSRGWHRQWRTGKHSFDSLGYVWNADGRPKVPKPTCDACSPGFGVLGWVLEQEDVTGTRLWKTAFFLTPGHEATRERCSKDQRVGLQWQLWEWCLHQDAAVWCEENLIAELNWMFNYCLTSWGLELDIFTACLFCLWYIVIRQCVLWKHRGLRAINQWQSLLSYGKGCGHAGAGPRFSQTAHQHLLLITVRRKLLDWRSVKILLKVLS